MIVYCYDISWSPTQVVLQLQRLSKLTKLGSAYGSKSSHHRTAQVTSSQSSSRIVQDEGMQFVPHQSFETLSDNNNIISMVELYNNIIGITIIPYSLKFSCPTKTLELRFWFLFTNQVGFVTGLLVSTVFMIILNFALLVNMAFVFR